ncbi:hypothetical protein QTP88_023560 [Uroleucon formosanum]
MESINDEKSDSSPVSSSNITRIEIWNDVTGINRKQFLFINTYSGLKIDIPADSSALDIFKLFFTSEIIDLIVIETNRNAEQFLSKNRLTKSSRFAKWIPTNENEIQKVFGLIIWMGPVLGKSVRLLGVTDVKLKRGEIVGKENAEGIVVAKWKDKRDVTMLLIRHGIDMIYTGKKNRNKENIVKPEIIISYNNGKAGTAVVNALIVYNRTHERKLKITQFRKILVDQMLELEKQNESIVNEPPTSGNKRSKGNTKHYFQETTEKCSRNRKLRKRCVHCYQSIKDVEGTVKAREAKKVSTF